MYKEYIPSNKVSEYVEVFWFSKGGKERLILPDNCSDIVIPLSNNKFPFFCGLYD